MQIEVLSRSFSDSAMNFELRCRINDVECVLLTTSERNLAIDKALRESGSKMPRPQQIERLERNPNSRPQLVYTPDTTATRCDIQKDKAKENDYLTTIGYREEALGTMSHPVSNRSHATTYKCSGTSP